MPSFRVIHGFRGLIRLMTSEIARFQAADLVMAVATDSKTAVAQTPLQGKARYHIGGAPSCSDERMQSGVERLL